MILKDIYDLELNPIIPMKDLEHGMLSLNILELFLIICVIYKSLDTCLSSIFPKNCLMEESL